MECTPFEFGNHGDELSGSPQYNQEEYEIVVNERLRANIKPIIPTITRNKVVLLNEQAHDSKKAETWANLLKSESTFFLQDGMLHAKQEMRNRQFLQP